ncbi:hypothetical protein F4818DRAFT_51040 [Hypoxylon cercidicola]|nr:hypothetical protein F4818DRAFT_51040 [Hypoxylon cercidicola]
MDPLSAVALAGTIVQFVTFTCSLLSKSSEIHHSATGNSDEVTSLQTIYRHLQSFSAKFSSPESVFIHRATSGGNSDNGTILALKDIFQSSKEDCDRILKVIEKLKVKDGPGHRWRSFRAALELIWKRNEIEDLDKRLQRAQSALTLHICAITSHFHKSNMNDFIKFRRNSEIYQIQQQEKIERMIDILESIKDRHLPRSPAFEGDRGNQENAPAIQPKDIKQLEEQMAELSLAAASISRQQDILRSLDFDHRPLRHDRIPEAHSRTFGWVYQGHSEHELPKWLKAGSGIFWVSGKPGSGKSTFMKFVADNEHTQGALCDWARPHKMVTASHYFWNAGTTMQKSQQGLLQELLLKILRQLPELIETTCSERWKDSGSLKKVQPPWSTKDLRRVLQSIAKSNVRAKICLFIDGLDEYDGDHLELCDDLLQATRTGNIKMCVSSRPWNVFKDAFGSNPLTTLRIHDLTEADIRAYTESHLSKHPRWPHLNGQPANGARLIDEVTKRAHGVFLWVFLVTKLLRGGLTNDDGFADLLKRLESFPSDLEPFFKHMLDAVEPFYHRKMSGALQITIASEKPLRYLFYSYHDNQYDDEDYAIKMKRRKDPMTETTLKDLQDKVARRLDAQCKGLLEVKGGLKGGHVDFLHRTVSDFLQTREMADYLLEKSAPHFNATLSILKGTVAFIKDTYATCMQHFSIDHDVGNGPLEMDMQIKDAIRCAARLEEESPNLCETAYNLLDELESTICKFNSTSGSPLIFPNHPEQTASEAARVFFRANVIKIGAIRFLRWKLSTEHDYFDEFVLPPLAILADPDFEAELGSNYLRYDTLGNILKLLLERGCDPNQVYSNERDLQWTPWSFFLFQIITGSGIGYRYMPQLHVGAFIAFLNHGADPNAKIYRTKRNRVSYFSTAWVDVLLLPFVMRPGWASESAYLQVLDAFLSRDVDMDSPALAPATEQTKFVHEHFFSAIKQREMSRGSRSSSHLSSDRGHDSDSDDTMINPRTSRLLSTVTLKLLIRAYGHPWPMDEIWKTVLDVFGPEQHKLMRARYASACKEKSEEALSGGNKRCSDDSIDSRRASKLTKMDDQ